MATANHILLRRITVTDPVSSITFSGIPQTGYTDLKLVSSARCTTTGYYSGYQQAMYARFNSSATSYSHKWIQGEGASSVNSGSNGYFTSGTSYAPIGTIVPSDWTANTFSNIETYIPSYTSSNYKSYSSDGAAENSSSYGSLIMFAGLWSNTSAVTDITLTLASGNFAIGSSFSLYGLADVNTTPTAAPKADGGDIIKTDGTYWYHAFTGSGVFKPQLNLTADVLVVAGGGSGGAQNGGGGGAGGLLSFTSQSLASTSTYTCAVGAGGTSVYQGAGTNGNNSTFGTLTTAIGGGAGGFFWGGGSGAPQIGGSGGGGMTTTLTGAAGTSGQGYAGGNGLSGDYAGAGGGGAGAVGSNVPSSERGGAGGIGATSSLMNAMGSATSTGQLSSGNYYYAGGGGGGGGTASGAGGTGGGGAARDGAVGYSGTANTGGGGGAARGAAAGGAGGSGIIIIRYPV